MLILCIDDEELGLEIRKLLLESQGYRVLTATSGQQGLEFVREFNIDAVLVDYNMPYLNGADLAYAIRAIRPEIPIIMLSGCPELIPHTALEILTTLVCKGADSDELLTAVRNSLEKRPPLRGTVLNVDDNPAYRHALSRMLQKAGFTVFEASTGAEALHKALSHPALILLDLKLPDISGFDVCKRLKSHANTADIPIIHISATYPAEIAENAALGSGAERFLERPPDLNVVVEVVRAELSKHYPDASDAARHF